MINYPWMRGTACFFQAAIGSKNKEGADLFNFEVLTPQYLMENSVNRWEEDI